MTKDNDKTIIIFLIAVAAIGVFIYGGTHDWFKSSMTSNLYSDTLNPSTFDNDYAGYTVDLSINPNVICRGDSATGSINSNIPNGACTIFMNPSGTWQIFKTITLDANGDYSETGSVTTAGSANFKAICCDANNNCKISNTVLLTVNNCANPPTCTDSDGGQMFYIAGKVTTPLGTNYDTCQPNGMDLLEFYCDGTTQKSIGIGCPNGCTQSSNGGYCNTPGSGGDGSGGGSPPPQWPCASIINPNSQSDCDNGYVSTVNSYCKYIPATIYSQAKCEVTALTTCNDNCINDGSSSGFCGNALAHSPCGSLGTHTSAYDTFCPIAFGSIHNWCCCS